MTKIVPLNLVHYLESCRNFCVVHILIAPVQNVFNVDLLTLREDDDGCKFLLSLVDIKII